MDLSTLQEIWFVLWGVVWAAYFIFDSFTIGNGILFPFITKDRGDRNQVHEIIGPFWNGAEVWLILAGGATFAAFPIVYGDMFSILYVAMFLVLFSLIFRAVSLELMHKDESPIWQKTCKWIFFVSSFLIAFLFGIFFSNLFLGLPIDSERTHAGVIYLFSMYSIMGGLLFVFLFSTIGSTWVHLKAEGPIVELAFKIGKFTAPVSAGILAMFYLATANSTQLFENFNEHTFLYIVPLLSLVTGISGVILFLRRKMGTSFSMLISTIALTFATFFIGMFPNMLPSSIGREFTLTCYNSSSSKLTLTLMLIITAIMVPIVLGYQIWSHFLFRKKIKKEDAIGY